MALLRSRWAEDFSPDFSTIVVRDGVGSDDAGYTPGPAALHEDHVDGSFGTAGRAGAGWFQITSGDGPHRVGLEVHDARPGPLGDEWSQVMETPYRSVTGTVGLTAMTDGPAVNVVELMGKGSYRLQVCRRWQGEGGVWLLRWWPASPEEPPQWLRRDPGPYEEADSLVEDVLAVAAWSPDYRHSCAVDELADRLLVPAADARTAVQRAVARYWLKLDGDLSGDGTVTLTVPGGGILVGP